MKKPIWFGVLEGDEELAQAIGEVLRSRGKDVRVRVYERFPIADGLSALLSRLTYKRWVVWLMPENAPNRLWVERESGMREAGMGLDVSIYLLMESGEIVDPGGESVPGEGLSEKAVEIAEQLTQES